jgi:outer membrane lipopolysaccharide assembly protein LptE/RlpB
MTTTQLKLLVLLATVLGLAACGIERRQDRREDRREDRKDLVSQTSQAQAPTVVSAVGPAPR